MGADGSVLYEIKGDASSVNRETRKAEGGFQELAGKAGISAGMMTAALAGVAAASAGVGLALREAAKIETTETGIATLVKDAGLAKAVIQDLRKLGAETPFEVGDLASAARGLLGGGTAVKDVRKELEILGDISSGAQTDLGGLVLVLNQVRGAGKLMGGDFLQLQQKGIGGLREELAKVEGIPVENLAKSIEQGKISADELFTAFRNLTGEGGLFFGSMENQSRTLAGRLSTLHDEFTSLLLVPGNAMLEPAKAFVETLTSGLQMATREASVIVKTMELAAQNGRLGEFIGLSVQLGLKVAWVEFLTFAIDNIGGLRDAVGEAIGNGIAAAYNNYARLFGKAELPIDDGALSSFIANITTDVETLQKKFSSMTQAGRLSLEGELTKTGDAMRAAMGKGGDELSEAAKKAEGALKGLNEAAGKATKAAGAGKADADGDGFVSKREKRAADLAQERGQRRADASKGYSRIQAGDVDFGGLNEFFALQFRNGEDRSGFEGARAFDAFGRGGAARVGNAAALFGVDKDKELYGQEAAFKALSRGVQVGALTPREAAGGAAETAKDSNQKLDAILTELRRIRTQ